MNSKVLGLASFLALVALVLSIAAAATWSTYANASTLMYVGIAFTALAFVAMVGGFVMGGKSSTPKSTELVTVTSTPPTDSPPSATSQDYANITL